MPQSQQQRPPLTRDVYAAYLNSATAMTRAPYDARNNQLAYDAQGARNAFWYDDQSMNVNHWADTQKLSNAQYRDVDVARWFANQQLASAGRARDFTVDMAGRRRGDVQAAANGAFGIDRGRLADQLGAAQRDRDLATGRADLGFRSNMRAAGNDAAARGAATSTGFADTRGDLRSQLGLERQGIANQDRASMDAFLRGQDQTALTRDTALRGADTSFADATGRADLDYADAQVRNLRENTTIDSIAKDYGVSSWQMKQAFELGAKKLGLDYGNLVMKIADATQSNNQQAQAAVNALTQQILLAAQSGMGPGMGVVTARAS
jgi:hypothetical protein